MITISTGVKLTLKAARVNVDLTQEEVAERMGVNVKTMQQWENGRTFPNVKQAKKLANIYGISIDDFTFF